MAEQILCSVAESLINRLASAACHEFRRINSVEDDLERLKETVGSIRAALLNADKKQKQDWVKRLKDVLIPAEDLLDEFHIQDMIHKRDKPHRNKVTKVLHSFSPKKISFLRNMAHEIGEIRKKYEDAVKDMSGLNLKSSDGEVEKTNIEWRETGSYVLESDIIGRDDDKEKIVNLLRQPHGDRNVSFVAIVGMGGLGKTALAQCIYNDKEVKGLFEKSMWVCVSDNFNVKTILKNMLKSLLPEKNIDDTSSLDNLETMLRDNLTGKRYLLVLDDVWNENPETLDKLRSYLMCGAQGSKVLVTTRSTIVAQRMDVKEPYVLRGLISGKSWSLLKKIAFGDDTTIGVDQNIESIGKMIAEKCKGVPLAIRSLGGILKNKREEEEWGHVLRGNFWKLCEDEEIILPILKLSYNNLLPQQRQCFAYCSLFPKDWEFEKDELIRMWMAHGYLDCPMKEKSMEDVGNQFVNIFLMKSFFQEAQWNEDGDIIGFKMHDLMHDLARQVAGDDCCYLDNNAKGCPERPVHVSVEFGAFDLLKSLNASRLRTLIVFSFNFDKLWYRDKQSIISTFKYLRVLKFYEDDIITLCVSFEKLKHLRLLDIDNTCVPESLQKSIENLVCLQTIKVNFDKKAILSTKVISKLINLRYLRIGTWITTNFLGLVHEKAIISPIGFGKLCIRQQKDAIFSKWISPLTNIIEITLDDCQGFKYLPPLERLPFLKSLEISCLYDLEYIYYEELNRDEPFFPSLKRLEIIVCSKLVGWKRMRDNFNDINTSLFPCLSFLKIIGCSMLTHIPTFPNIKSLSLEDCNFGEVLKATLNLTASLSMLKSLKICGFRETALYLKNVPQHWLQNLTSLENLEFIFLLSQHFQAIERWFKDDINYLPSIPKITFRFCHYLKALPDWICKISSLQHIKIDNCRELALLPEGVTRLTNLHTLEIIRCPLLIEECHKETSATRARIAHIPNIIMI